MQQSIIQVSLYSPLMTSSNSMLEFTEIPTPDESPNYCTCCLQLGPHVPLIGMFKCISNCIQAPRDARPHLDHV